MNRQMLSLPSWVSIPNAGGFFVMSPPVGIALQLLFIINNRESDIRLESPDDRLFYHVLEKWLGENAIVFKDMLPRRANEYLLRILFGDGVEKKADNGEETKIPDIVWEELVSDYARFYNVEPHYVLENIPFSRFIVFKNLIELQRSREKLSWYDLYTLPNMKTPSEVVNGWRKSAGLAYRTEAGIEEVMNAHDESLKQNPEDRPALRALKQMQQNDPKRNND